jgi:hypothetical protein
MRMRCQKRNSTPFAGYSFKKIFRKFMWTLLSLASLLQTTAA